MSLTYASREGDVPALAGLSLDVVSGEFVCIVGPSGCGKTSLLRLIAGLIPPGEGDVLVGGIPAARAVNGHVRSVLVFQDHGLFPWMRVVDNAAFGLEAQGVDLHTRREAALKWLGRMGMSAFARSYPHQLSGGMRQRVALARGFLTDAPVLLMDEPLGSLDAQMRVLLQAELLEQWAERRRTVVYVTHDIDEALLLGDRVMVMSGRPGRIIATHASPLGRPRSLEDLGHPALVELKWEIWHAIRAQVVHDLQVAP